MFYRITYLHLLSFLLNFCRITFHCPYNWIACSLEPSPRGVFCLLPCHLSLLVSPLALFLSTISFSVPVVLYIFGLGYFSSFSIYFYLDLLWVDSIIFARHGNILWYAHIFFSLKIIHINPHSTNLKWLSYSSCFYFIFHCLYHSVLISFFVYICFVFYLPPSVYMSLACSVISLKCTK